MKGTGLWQKKEKLDKFAQPRNAETKLTIAGLRLWPLVACENCRLLPEE